MATRLVALPLAASPCRGARLPRRRLDGVRPRRSCVACGAAPAQARSDLLTYEVQLQELKRQLLDATAGTRRGSAATAEQRGVIAELQLELVQAGNQLKQLRGQREPGAQQEAADDRGRDSLSPLQRQLAGKWKVEYTTAPDVLQILFVPRLAPLVTVGDIFQSFGEDGCTVYNVIELGGEPFLQADRGLTLTVKATYSEAPAIGLVDSTSVEGSVREKVDRIKLRFVEGRLSDLNISPLAETLLAPALLPRTALNMSILQALREFEVKVPLTAPTPFDDRSTRAAAVASSTELSPLPSNNAERGGASYIIDYIDEDILIGTSVGPAGSFIFTRAS